MIVTLIEKIYSFLWGDLVQIPLPGGSSLGISLLIILLIPTGIYFTIRTRFLPIRLFPDMVGALVEEEKGKKQSLILPDADRINCDKSWDGKSGRGSCCNFSRRCRCSFLDVGDCTDRFVHCFYRGNTGTDIQRKGSFIRRLQRRAGILYPRLCGGKTEEKKKKGLLFPCCLQFQV